MSLLWGRFSGKLELIRGCLPGIMGKSSWGLLCVCVFVSWLFPLYRGVKPSQGLEFPFGLMSMYAEGELGGEGAVRESPDISEPDLLSPSKALSLTGRGSL